MKPLVLDFDGKQVIVSSDNRTNLIWLQINADRGSKGIALSREQAVEISCFLIGAVRDCPPK